MLYVCLAVILIILLLLSIPVSLGYDSGENRVRVKWLGLTLSRKFKRGKPGKPGKKPHREGKGPRWAAIRRLGQERALIAELVQRAVRLGRDLLGVISFRGSEASFSLPEPMWNGMLYAALTNINLDGVRLTANFHQLNFVRIWATFFPFRVMAKCLGGLAGLPWLRLVRMIRDVSNNR